MNKKKIILFLLLFSLGSFLIALNTFERRGVNTAPVPDDTREFSLPLKAHLQTGDLIVAQGKSFFSNALRKMNDRDKTYSHCGILEKRNSKYWIWHITGGAEDPGVVYKERLKNFLHPSSVNRYAAFRFDLDSMQLLHLVEVVQGFAAEKRKFDMKFDLSDDRELYCSEMVYNALQTVTRDRDFIPLSHRKDRAFVGIDDLYLNQHVILIDEKKYN